MFPSFCFASCNSMLHSFLKLILNSHDMKTTFFSNVLCNILFCELLLHYSCKKLPLTLPELYMLNILSFIFSYRKENHVLFSQVLQRKFCERGLFQGFFLNTEHNLVPRCLRQEEIWENCRIFVCFVFHDTKLQIIRFGSLIHRIYYEFMCLSAYWQWTTVSEKSYLITVPRIFSGFSVHRLIFRTASRIRGLKVSNSCF